MAVLRHCGMWHRGLRIDVGEDYCMSLAGGLKGFWVGCGLVSYHNFNFVSDVQFSLLNDILYSLRMRSV